MDNPHNILIVDDDPRVSRLVKRYLEQEGYKLYTAHSGKEMRQVINESKIDLVLLDIRLPDEDGFTLVRELRALPHLAIIMVTGKADPRDKVLGLELGADDYVTKPFDLRELLARVRSVLRRVAQESAAPAAAGNRAVACFAQWRLDLSAHELTHQDGSRVLLTTREFQLLAVLVEHAPRVLTRDFILELLAGRDWTPIDRSIDVLIGKLRKKLGDDAQEPVLLKTIRGVGYKLACPVEFL
jgi:two-component system OmpR family response regulator